MADRPLILSCQTNLALFFRAILQGILQGIDDFGTSLTVSSRYYGYSRTGEIFVVQELLFGCHYWGDWYLKGARVSVFPAG